MIKIMQHCSYLGCPLVVFRNIFLLFDPSTFFGLDYVNKFNSFYSDSENVLESSMKKNRQYDNLKNF